MRLLAGALVVLVLVATASATAPIYTKGSLGKGKFNKVGCALPITKVACRVDPKGNLQDFLWGSYGPATGAVPSPVGYLGPSTVNNIQFFYTQNYCPGGWSGACEAFGADGTAGSSNMGFTNQLIDFGAAFAGGGGANVPLEMDIGFLTGMTICWGKKGIKGITFTSTAYRTSWQLPANNRDPIPVWALSPGGITGATQSCGQVTTCTATTTYTAPRGKAIGGFEYKCKFSQDWFGYPQTGTYGTGGAGKVKYALKSIDKVCLTNVGPPPTTRFQPSTGTPNAAGDPDQLRYQCGGN